MKLQDIIFVAIFVSLLWLRNPRRLALAGIISLFLSMPLFHFWVFFTAQRLTYYAVAFFLGSVILNLMNFRKEVQNT